MRIGQKLLFHGKNSEKPDYKSFKISPGKRMENCQMAILHPLFLIHLNLRLYDNTTPSFVYVQ